MPTFVAMMTLLRFPPRASNLNEDASSRVHPKTFPPKTSGEISSPDLPSLRLFIQSRLLRREFIHLLWMNFRRIKVHRLACPRLIKPQCSLWRFSALSVLNSEKDQHRGHKKSRRTTERC